MLVRGINGWNYGNWIRTVSDIFLSCHLHDGELSDQATVSSRQVTNFFRTETTIGIFSYFSAFSEALLIVSCCENPYFANSVSILRWDRFAIVRCICIKFSYTLSYCCGLCVVLAFHLSRSQHYFDHNSHYRLKCLSNWRSIQTRDTGRQENTKIHYFRSPSTGVSYTDDHPSFKVT